MPNLGSEPRKQCGHAPGDGAADQDVPSVDAAVLHDEGERDPHQSHDHDESRTGQELVLETRSPVDPMAWRHTRGGIVEAHNFCLLASIKQPSYSQNVYKIRQSSNSFVICVIPNTMFDQ